MPKTYVYITRWNEFAGQPGIALFEFDPKTETLEFKANMEDKLTTGCTCIDKNRNILYVTNEIKENPAYRKGGGGLVYAFRIDPQSGMLTRLSCVQSCCPCPTYISLDPSGKYLVCANHSSYFAVTKTVHGTDGKWHARVEYDDATVDLFRIQEDGGIGELVDVVKHDGKVDSFMLHCHPHSAVWAPNGNFFACCDKGDDRIYMYGIDYKNEKLVLMCEPYADDCGSSPRYCVFHPTKPFFYNNHERSVNISSFKYGENGELEKLCSASCLPTGIELPKASGFLPGQKPALQAMMISCDGRFIYSVVNGKGVDGISVISTNGDGGSLKLIQYERVEGIWARGVGISPDGKYLLLTCLDGGGEVFGFQIGEDGKLIPCGVVARVPGGAYVTFFEVE